MPLELDVSSVDTPFEEPIADEFSTSLFAPQSYTTTLRVMALDSDTPDASELKEGIYIAKITSLNGTKTVKLVKN